MIALVLESSTTSAKAMLYSSEEGIVDVKAVPYDAKYNYDGMQDPEYVFSKTIEMGRLVSEGYHVDVIAICGVWHSVMACDKNMSPVSPVYSWSYTGAAELTSKLRQDEGYANDYYHRCGCMPHVTYTPFKLMHLKKQGMNLDDKYLCEQSTYNFFQLTGKYHSSHSLISGGGLLNINEKTYDQQILREIGISENQLGSLVTYKDTQPLNENGARLLGLKAGIPVIPPMADGAMNQVGAGALNPDRIMTLSVGTSAAIRMTTEQPLLPEEPSTWCYLSPSSWWISGAATAGACNCIDWALKSLFPKGTSHLDVQMNKVDFDDLPVFLPFIFGERCPGWKDERKAGFIDINNNHTNLDLYYSVMFGVLFNLFQCYEILCGLNGSPDRVKISGGILNSPIWTQICSDIFRKDLEIPGAGMEHASMMGGVVLASELFGELSDIGQYETETKEIVKYNPERHEEYMEYYQRYLHWYGETKTDFKGDIL